MPDGSIKEFGHRRPPSFEPPEPVKRSHHVALLLMGTIAIGGGAYALMPSEKCEPDRPGIAADPPQADCSARHSSSSAGGHGYWGGGSSSRTSLFGGDASPVDASSGAKAGSSPETGHVTRGGFGSFARAFAMHFSGGG
jgi:hypothetical protein